MTITVSLLPDDDARCQIIEGDQRCERYSMGAKLTGVIESGTQLTVKLCSDHAMSVAAQIPGSKIVGSEGAS